ncbi:conjugative relaxase domain-containing protein, TrwC/TraI family [Microbacterium testaceum StLB037]|uniref:Conjugative relaxase domain-containing protein, TrwC/TraI family n=1 Tax=Microbacterium testaceum (strain StLB037) TaxID=979556 RepID=A0A1H0LCU4_MICTS|nr:MobF family relaxase [Microbacterium testaceum]SDO66037.1 conjugative relaxase domain-containing protein, TrwC/TraI family [Microbacterium testaceum StLB037]
MRVMSAGDGYKYLLRTVTAADGDRSLSTPLTRYYSAEGTPPGRWLGAGFAGLGDKQIVEGDQVSEAQLQLLVGMGRDPITGKPLGRAYPEYRPVGERVAERVAALDPELGSASRAEATAVIEAEEAARGVRRAVAGYDFAFSIPKSASVLWAIADAGTQALIADAHHAAVAEMVAFMEREVAATRTGATGRDGAVAQVDVRGLVATAFDHYDSRAGDPHLHTHVVISNKVQTVLDGKWRSLDGRPMHAATVALSELHEAVFADHLTRMLGVEWEAREQGRDRNPAWAVVGVAEELVKEFSTRARHIDVETDRLIDRYVSEHGRRPSPATIMKLRAQATLSTRPKKEVHSLADLTASWRRRAGQVLGSDATAWARAVSVNETPLLLRADDIPLDVITNLGESVVGTVGEKRSAWRRWNLMAEAARQTTGYRFASTEDRKAIVGLVVDAAEAASLRLTPPELVSSPAVFQRPDGTSVFRPKHSVVFSSEVLLAAEDRLLERARTTTVPTVPLATLERITARPDRAGRTLGPDQADALAKIALSGRMIDVLVGPAGAGKTTAMRALRTAWEREHGRGSVVGLAPSAVAAQVLADDLGITTENTAKWWDTHQRTGATFQKSQLVIIDEASLAGTLSLDRITALAEQAEAKVLLVGDRAQLQSVTAGGGFSLLVHDRNDAPELLDVHRFVNEWEKTASLDLRHGRTEAIDTYADHDRITGGDTETMIDTAYTAWRTDALAGIATVLIADSTESVHALNQRARADLILDGTVNALREIELHDTSRASIGDSIITRRNDRRLRAGRGWVRNGDRWTVTDVRDDGSLTVRRAGPRRGGAVILPAGYVAEHVDLGYAVTAHRAQGITTGTSHVLADSTTTRENLYVAMTRGRQANLVYVATDRPDDNHDVSHPADDAEATARTVLYGVLQHVGAELSGRETIAAEQEVWGSIAQLAAEYETIAQAAQHDRFATLIRESGFTPEAAEDTIHSEAFRALSSEMRRAEANHHNIDALMPRLVAARGFGDADDIASVLHHRLARATARPAGSGRTRKVPQLIAGLIPEAAGVTNSEMQGALSERRDLIEQRADVILDRAVSEKQDWVLALGTSAIEPRVRAMWRSQARTVAAYRDRYGITAKSPLGSAPDSDAQKIDAARAAAALVRLRDIAAQASEPDARRLRGRARRGLVR